MQTLRFALFIVCSAPDDSHMCIDETSRANAKSLSMHRVLMLLCCHRQLLHGQPSWPCPTVSFFQHEHYSTCLTWSLPCICVQNAQCQCKWLPVMLTKNVFLFSGSVGVVYGDLGKLTQTLMHLPTFRHSLFHVFKSCIVALLLCKLPLEITLLHALQAAQENKTKMLGMNWKPPAC